MATLDELLSDDKTEPAGIDKLLDEPAGTPEVGPKSGSFNQNPSSDAPWWTRAASTGFGDTIHGPAQLMQNLVPDRVMNVARTAGASIAGALGANELAQDLARPVSTEEFNQMEAEREGAYQAERKEAGREGMDWWRTAGSLANPLAWASPSGEATTLWTAIKAGSKAGAFQSLLQPVASEGNFLWDKGMQAVLGGVTGGTLSGGLKLLEPALQFGASWARRVLGPSASDRAIEQAADQVTRNVTKTAVGDAPVNPDVYSAIRQDVADAMKAGVAPSAEIIARRADAAALPVPIHMTRAQLSRDPMAWAWEHRVSGQQGVGEPLSELLSGQNRAMIQNINALGAQNAPAPYAASERVIQKLSDINEQMRAQVDEAYRAVRNSAGRPARVSTDGFVAAAKTRFTEGNPSMADMVNLGDYLPEKARLNFNDIVSGKIPMTVDAIQFFDRAWSGMQRGAKDDTERAAIGALRSALHDTPIDDALGQEAMQAYNKARTLARQRFSLIESNPALKLVDSEKAEPDRFFQKYVQGANVSELRRLRQIIGPEETEMLQKTFVGQLKRAALNRGSDETSKFSQAAYNSIMQDPVQAPRIQELFADNKKTLDQLYRLGRVSENLMKPDAAARVNYSNTAVEASNIVRDVVRSETGQAVSSLLPNWMTGLGRTMGDAGRRVEESRAVQRAVAPGVTEGPLPKPRQPEFGRLSDLLSRGSAASVTADQRNKDRE